jgi:hypothetical protein
MNDFILTPPFAVGRDVAVSLIQAGDMPAPESMVVTLGEWSTLDLLAHWNAEVGAILDSQRDRCCIVSGLTVVAAKLVPTEWWKMFKLGSEVRIQYQVLNTQEAGSPGAWDAPENWWKNIPEYRRFFDDGDGVREVSEWVVSIDSLARWHHQCGVLRRRIQSVEEE